MLLHLLCSYCPLRLKKGNSLFSTLLRPDFLFYFCHAAIIKICICKCFDFYKLSSTSLTIIINASEVLTSQIKHQPEFSVFSHYNVGFVKVNLWKRICLKKQDTYCLNHDQIWVTRSIIWMSFHTENNYHQVRGLGSMGFWDNDSWTGKQAFPSVVSCWVIPALMNVCNELKVGKYEYVCIIHPTSWLTCECPVRNHTSV